MDHNRVLVTGASGFIGWQCLHPLVERGYKVIAVHRSPLQKVIDEVRWAECDLLNDTQRHAPAPHPHPPLKSWRTPS